MKTRLILLILIIAGLLISQTEKGISIKSKPGNEGKRWAVCVGINNYDYNGILDLKKAQNDAKALGGVLKDYGQFDYVFVMTDEDPRSVDYPSTGKFKSKLRYLEQFLEPEDLVVFSFSGHGVSDEKGNGYILMTDSDPDNVFNTSVQISEVTNTLKKVGVKKSLLLVDACREEFRENRGINRNGLKSQKFEQSEVAATFYATKAGGFSYEDDKGDYGAFTNYILKGIQGEADKTNYQGNEDGIVTFTELASFVEDGVMNWALEKGKVQKPYTKIYGEKYGDLALAAYKGVTFRPQTAAGRTQIQGTPEMIFVQGGTFQMGGTESDEKPVHSVTVGDYYIGKTEVTVAEFRKFVDAANYRTDAEKGGGAYVYTTRWEQKSDANWKNPYFSQSDNHPVTCVSWNDATAYCSWLSSTTGQTYRLPTEAEWEYAARGGSQSRNHTYSGSSSIDGVAWYWDNSSKKTQPVGTKQPNELGIYDMSGNVWEWCSDWYGSYSSGSQTNPTGASSGSSRVLRGGSWCSGATYCRVARRDSLTPGNGNNYGGGFRVVRLP